MTRTPTHQINSTLHSYPLLLNHAYIVIPMIQIAKINELNNGNEFQGFVKKRDITVYVITRRPDPIKSRNF